MGSRLFSVVSILLMLLLSVLAMPAMAAEAGDEEIDPGEAMEEEEPLPSLDEIGSGSEISEDFRPEPPETPVFADALRYPLVIVGVVVTIVVLTLYLVWQPRFGREAKEKSKR